MVDYLTKKVKKNEGDARQYYISNSHPAIIPPDQFDLVQVELERRSRHGSKLSGKNVLTAKLVCGDCGGYFGHKVFHGKDKYRTDVWYCNQRYNGDKVCETPLLKECAIKKAFVNAFNKVLKNKAAYKALYETELEKLSDTTVLESQRAQAEEALQGALESLQVIIRENTQYKQDQRLYLEKYNTQKQVVDEKKAALEMAKKAILEQTAKKEKLRRFMNALALCNDEVIEFQDDVVTLAVDRILVEKGDKGRLVFCFTDESEITERLDD